jgi:hypothetical protein
LGADALTCCFADQLRRAAVCRFAYRFGRYPAQLFRHQSYSIYLKFFVQKIYTVPHLWRNLVPVYISTVFNLAKLGLDAGFSFTLAPIPLFIQFLSQFFIPLFQDGYNKCAAKFHRCSKCALY